MKQSAGLLLYKITGDDLSVLLVHPGGPFWAKKDAGAWTIPKGGVEPGEELLSAAIREFNEETGRVISGKFIPLTPVKQKGGKLVHAWAIEGAFEMAHLKSNTFEMEWPPKSGKLRTFPEVDRAGWFGVTEAFIKILPGQRDFISELQKLLSI
ncbi:MAG: NUDIX domain-containing protein [Bacteroidota bacterium]